MREERSPIRKPDEGPAPGQYNSNMYNFGSNGKGVTMGEKYKFVPKEGPAPGQYNPMDT